MTVRAILPIDHPLLRKMAKPVVRFGPALRRLFDDMFATLHEAGGAGLAGPQVGKVIRLFVAEFEGRRVALCNPVIIHQERESIGTEGCLSLPVFVGLRVKRAASIDIEGQDTQGNKLSLSAEGIFARVLQHEIDHLHGVLFLDHLQDPRDLRAIRTDEVVEARENAPVAAGSSA